MLVVHPMMRIHGFGPSIAPARPVMQLLEKLCPVYREHLPGAPTHGEVIHCFDIRGALPCDFTRLLPIGNSQQVEPGLGEVVSQNVINDSEHQHFISNLHGLGATEPLLSRRGPSSSQNKFLND